MQNMQKWQNIMQQYANYNSAWQARSGSGSPPAPLGAEAAPAAAAAWRQPVTVGLMLRTSIQLFF
jgi:hypothetical protein